MAEAFICDAVRTPIGRYGGALAAVRADDLAAAPLAALKARNPDVDWAAVDDVIYGCANQAGEDNRNVARMAALLAGLPIDVAGRDGEPAVRLRHGGGRPGGARDQGRRRRSHHRRRRREHEPRAVRDAEGRDRVRPRQRRLRHDHRLALRQSRRCAPRYGTDSMPETADNVAADYGVSRADQDAFALRSQQRWASAQGAGIFRRRDRRRARRAQARASR